MAHCLLLCSLSTFWGRCWGLRYETIPFLTLTYKTDEDGKLTNENITASGYKLNLIGSSSATYSIISKYLGVDWDQILKFINTRSDIAFAPTM